MSETPQEKASADDKTAVAVVEPGPVSQWLKSQGFEHQILESDHLGLEQIGVDPMLLPIIAAALKGFGFDYLQCQGGYDEGPGEHLVCFYHLVAMSEMVEAMEPLFNMLFGEYFDSQREAAFKLVSFSSSLQHMVAVIHAIGLAAESAARRACRKAT